MGGRVTAVSRAQPSRVPPSPHHRSARRLCAQRARPNADPEVLPPPPAPHVRDHDLLRACSIFLLARTGRSPNGPGTAHEPELAAVLAADVAAYGVTGREIVMEVLRARAGTFPTTVLSVTASALDSSVRVDYHDGSGETVRCGLRNRQSHRRPRSGAPPTRARVVVERVEMHREAAAGAAGAGPHGHAPGSTAGMTGVEVLWSAVRFLHADLDRDYAAQRRWLADDAAAFGATGREGVLAANGEGLPEADKTVYSIPYPLTVDEGAGTVAGGPGDPGTATVVLMFNAFSARGGLKYVGTDLMVVDKGSGLVRRIVTVNHSSGVVYSPESAQFSMRSRPGRLPKKTPPSKL